MKYKIQEIFQSENCYLLREVTLKAVHFCVKWVALRFTFAHKVYTFVGSNGILPRNRDIFYPDVGQTLAVVYYDSWILWWVFRINKSRTWVFPSVIILCINHVWCYAAHSMSGYGTLGTWCLGFIADRSYLTLWDALTDIVYLRSLHDNLHEWDFVEAITYLCQNNLMF